MYLLNYKKLYSSSRTLNLTACRWGMGYFEPPIIFDRDTFTSWYLYIWNQLVKANKNMGSNYLILSRLILVGSANSKCPVCKIGGPQIRDSPIGLIVLIALIVLIKKGKHLTDLNRMHNFMLIINLIWIINKYKYSVLKIFPFKRCIYIYILLLFFVISKF
jgi:hypothetical protein